MQSKNLFQAIESEQFAARMSIASTRDVFIRALEKDRDFQRLRAFIAEDINRAMLVFKRIKLLSSLEFDYQYANPNDIALASYAWALNFAYPIIAQLTTGILVGTRQSWWARQIGSYIEQLPTQQTKNSDTLSSKKDRQWDPLGKSLLLNTHAINALYFKCLSAFVRNTELTFFLTGESNQTYRRGDLPGPPEKISRHLFGVFGVESDTEQPPMAQYEEVWTI